MFLVVKKDDYIARVMARARAEARVPRTAFDREFVRAAVELAGKAADFDAYQQQVYERCSQMTPSQTS